MDSLESGKTLDVSLAGGHAILQPPYRIMQWGVSEEDYLRIATEDVAAELFNGVLIIHSPANIAHEEIFRFLLNLLDSYAQEKKCGEVLGSRVVMRLSSKVYFEPDLLFLPNADLWRKQETKLEGFAPFLVEILSPSTRDFDLDQKVPTYLQNGVQEVWVIDPATKILQQYLASDPTKPKLHAKKDRVKSVVIPGFWLELDWVWPESKKRALDCLKRILNEK